MWKLNGNVRENDLWVLIFFPFSTFLCFCVSCLEAKVRHGNRSLRRQHIWSPLKDEMRNEKSTPKKFNITSEKWWLEDYLLKWFLFRGFVKHFLVKLAGSTIFTINLRTHTSCQVANLPSPGTGVTLQSVSRTKCFHDHRPQNLTNLSTIEESKMLISVLINQDMVQKVGQNAQQLNESEANCASASDSSICSGGLWITSWGPAVNPKETI